MSSVISKDIAKRTRLSINLLSSNGALQTPLSDAHVSAHSTKE
jgi:hypothetical protein